MREEIMVNHNDKSQMHSLNDKWDMYYHLPTDPNWDLRSYKPIMKGINKMEDTLAIIRAININVIKGCMLFLMRDGITPRWEDPRNRNGGCFSYKIHNKNVANCWNKLFKYVTGESFSTIENVNKHINGITVSPKRNFCIIKVWMDTDKYQDSSVFNDIMDEQSSYECIFKKQEPED